MRQRCVAFRHEFWAPEESKRDGVLACSWHQECGSKPTVTPLQQGSPLSGRQSSNCAISSWPLMHPFLSFGACFFSSLSACKRNVNERRYHLLTDVSPSRRLVPSFHTVFDFRRLTVLRPCHAPYLDRVLAKGLLSEGHDDALALFRSLPTILLPLRRLGPWYW